MFNLHHIQLSTIQNIDRLLPPNKVTCILGESGSG